MVFLKRLLLFFLILICLASVSAAEDVSNETIECDDFQDNLCVGNADLDTTVQMDESQESLSAGESPDNPVTNEAQLWSRYFGAAQSSTINIYIANGTYVSNRIYSWPVNVTFIGQGENTILKGISTVAGPGISPSELNYAIPFTFVNLTFVGGVNDLSRSCKFINCTIIDSLTFTKYFYDNPDKMNLKRALTDCYALRTYFYEFDNCVFKNYNGNGSYLTAYQFSRVSFNNCNFTNISADSIICYANDVSYEKIKDYLLRLGWSLAEIERISYDGLYFDNCLFNDSSYVAITDSYTSLNRNITGCSDIVSDYYGVFPSQDGLHQYYSLPIPVGAALTVAVDDIVYGDSFVINANFNNRICDDVVAVINKNKYTVKVINGTGCLNVSDVFDSGVLNVKSNSAYNGFNFTTNFTISKINTNFIVPSANSVYNEGKYLVITLKDYKNNVLSNALVNVKIGSKVFEVYTQPNGQAKISLNNLIPKTYSVIVSFEGDKNHIDSTFASKVIVSKATPKLTAKAKTFKKSVKTKKYAVTLKDNTGKVMKKVKLTLKIKGKTYKATTNTKGKATFKITKFTKKGTYTATITFKGNKNYKAATKKVKIKIK